MSSQAALVPSFEVELSEILASNGIDEAGNPFSFSPTANVESGLSWTGRVTMSTTVDSDKDVHLFSTNMIASVPPSVRVKAGQSFADFTAPRVGEVVDTTDVMIVASFQSFFPSSAKILTLHIAPPPK
jgi:hypothetical protein